MKGTFVVKPIIYGNVATYLGKKAEEGVRTHKWTCYVRGVDNEDLSYFIKKVVFVLHESFEEPTRVVESPPFEISESGWGEFEILIKIYFQDPNEKPVEVYHMLRLFPAEDVTKLTKKPVIAEEYDELIFHEPSDKFYKTLTEGPKVRGKKLSCQAAIDAAAPPLTDAKDLERIRIATRKIEKQIKELQARSEKADSEIRSLKEEIAQMDDTATTITNTNTT